MANADADTLWTVEQWAAAVNAIVTDVKAGESPQNAAQRHIGAVHGEFALDAFFAGWTKVGTMYTGSPGWMAGRDAQRLIAAHRQIAATDNADRV